VKLSVLAVSGIAWMAAAGVNPSFGQSSPDEPTRREIETAYRSKSGEGGTFIPGVRWERWRIKEIRGWSLQLKRVEEKRGLGILTLQYRAVAKKNGACAGYRIRDTMILPPFNQQVKPNLVVEPDGVRACR
jgi:hypothetical protein